MVVLLVVFDRDIRALKTPFLATILATGKHELDRKSSPRSNPVQNVIGERWKPLGPVPTPNRKVKCFLALHRPVTLSALHQDAGTEGFA